MNESFPGDDPHRQLSAEQQSCFIAEFALRRKRQAVGNACAAILLLLGIAAFGVLANTGTGVTPELFFVPLGIGLCGLFGTAIFQFVNLRCPRCNAGQAKVPRARYCHNCGLRLRRDKVKGMEGIK